MEWKTHFSVKGLLREISEKEAIEIRDISIVIKIPFNWINVVGNKAGIKSNRNIIIERIGSKKTGY